MAEIGTITVSRLNEYIKHKLDNDLILKGISVSGEISNCRTYSSGHMYFTLKDSGSSLRCVMFKGYRVALTQKVNDGDAVTVRGDVSVYVRDGGYQLYATSIKKQGAGTLGLFGHETSFQASVAHMRNASRRAPARPTETC